jgi:hypothetical protein
MNKPLTYHSGVDHSAINGVDILDFVNHVAKLRDVQTQYFAAAKEDRETGNHWAWKRPETKALLKLSKQLEGELDRMIAIIYSEKGGDNE